MIPLKIHNTATRLRSPPKFCVAGVAKARVRLRLGKDKLRDVEMPIAWQRNGYPNRDAIAIEMVGMMIGKN